MNKYAKTWVKALESGKFRQGRQVLTARKNKALAHCCLGLACHINREELSSTKVGSCISYDRQASVLPEFMVDKLGLGTCGGGFVVDKTVAALINGIAGMQLVYPGDKYDLITLNDKNRFTFKEIAQVIRAKPPGLFT